MINTIKPINSEILHRVCEFHRKNPNVTFAGCTCSSSYTAKEKKFNTVQDKGANFRDKDGKLYLVRCYVCDSELGRENWTCAVASGTCAFCGYAE